MPYRQLVGDPAGSTSIELDGADDEFRVSYRDDSGRLRATLLGNRPADVAGARQELEAAA